MSLTLCMRCGRVGDDAKGTSENACPDCLKKDAMAWRMHQEKKRVKRERKKRRKHGR